MFLINNTIGYILVIIGMCFIISGIVGIIRFPGALNKLHAAGVLDVCGVPLFLIGLLFFQEDWIGIVKIIFIIVMIFILSPLSSSSIAKACIILSASEKTKLTSSNEENIDKI